MMKNLLLLAAATLSISSVFAAPIKAPHITVELLSEKEAVASNTTQYIGIHFRPDPEWHIYWKNPGDSGLPPKVEWKIEPGSVTASDFIFPAPERIPYGTLVNFGYNGDQLILAELKTGSLKPGSQVKITANARWLVCKEECVPGKATMSLSLPVIEAGEFEKTAGTNTALFKKALAELPLKKKPSEYPQFRVVHEKKSDGSGLFTINVIPENAAITKKYETAKFFFFPEGEYGFSASSPQTTSRSKEQVDHQISQKEYKPVPVVRGVLKIGDAHYEIEEIFDPKAAAALAIDTRAKMNQSGMADSSLLLMLAFAFIGGIILNLMPCILPVLSIKVMALVNQSGQTRSQIRNHGLIFTLGILVSFWLLAGVLIFLRAGGASLGWGFQLQSPPFVASLIVLFFLMGLNLMGVFEVGGRLMGVGGGLAKKSGYLGSFFTGVLTTIAATPCSAPFMGTALGFALTQSAAISVLVLTMLALGLAFPYLVFSYIPQAARLLPKPGKWMETLKQFLAFPLFATVVWLVSVISNQAGTTGVFDALFAALLAYFAVWLGSKTTIRQVPKVSKWALIAISCLLAISLVLSIQSLPVDAQVASGKKIPAPWSAFTPDRLAQDLSSGKTVLVNLTADWCVTCKVNESVVFENADVKKALSEDGVSALMGDWTNGDPVLTEYMASNGRNSVPVYLLYKKGSTQPEMLPQILTPKMVLDKLK